MSRASFALGLTAMDTADGMRAARGMEAAAAGETAKRARCEARQPGPEGTRPHTPVRLSEIPTHAGRMTELERRYDEFIAIEDQC